jgi:hypothetical protein
MMSQSSEFFFNNPIVKVHGVGHKDAVFGHFEHFLGNLVKSRGIVNGLIVDSGESGNEIGNGALRVHQRRKFFNYPFSIKSKNGYFGDFVSFETVSGGFYINYGVQQAMSLHYRRKVSKNEKSHQIGGFFMNFFLGYKGISLLSIAMMK